MGVLELRHGSDVARAQSLHFHPLLALLHREMVEFLYRLVLRVVDLASVPNLAGVQAEQSDIADVRLRDRLEHPAQERRSGISTETTGERRLQGRGEQLDHLLQECSSAVRQLAAAAEERHHSACHDRLLYCRDELLAGYFLAAEVALDQLVVGGGDRLGQLFSVLLKQTLEFVRDRHHLVLAGLGPLLIEVAVAGEEVDDPVEVVAIADGYLDRDDPGCQMGLHIVEDPLEVGVLLVHERNEQDSGQMQLVADFPDFFGPHLYSTRPAQYDDGGIGRIEAADDFAEVVEVSWSVDEIDLGIQPLGVAEAQIDGVLAFDFVGRVIGERVTVFDRAVAPAGAAYEGQGVNQGRLPAGPVPDKRHVSDGVGAIDLHGLHLLG